MPRISIVIPVYNAENTIQRCLDSVFNQTFTDFEIVFANDGSTDNSVDIINKYLEKKKFKNYRILSQQNAGPGIARNLAIQNAVADLVAFLDSDDVWEKTHLSTLIDFFDNNDIDLVCTTKNINVSKQVTVTLKKLLFRCYIQSSTLLIKKEILINTHFRDMKRYSEDYDLWLRLAAKNKKIVFLPIKDVRNCDDKNAFGVSGLSKNLWKMEKNELENYIYLLKNSHINMFMFILVTAFSLIKYFLRIVKSFLK